MSTDTQSNLIRLTDAQSQNVTTRRYEAARPEHTFPTFTNDTGGTLPADTVIEIYKIKPRQILLPNSTISNSALGASRTIEVGWAAYEDPGDVQDTIRFITDSNMDRATYENWVVHADGAVSEATASPA